MRHRRGACCTLEDDPTRPKDDDVFYTLIFAGLAIFIIVVVLVQKARSK